MAQDSSLNIKADLSQHKMTQKSSLLCLSNEWNIKGSERNRQFNHRMLKTNLKIDKNEIDCLFHNHKNHFSWLIVNVHTMMQWAKRVMIGNVIVGS